MDSGGRDERVGSCGDVSSTLGGMRSPLTPPTNRSLSIRSARKDGKQDKSSNRHRFSMTTLRGYQQPELSKKLYKIIKNENVVIGAYESAGRERVSIASQLSDWGEATGDESVSDISDKLGVLLSEIGEQEDIFAQSLEEYRGVLKQIRNTESSVQPSRDSRNKISDEIQRLKYKDPANTKLVTLEQELVRAEAQNLVAEAQLSNVTRQKVKEAFDLHTAAIIERAEKQIILAQHARRLVNLLDDTPIVPGDAVKPYEQSTAARDILNDAEGDLRAWEPSMYPITSNANEMGQNLVPKPETVAAGQQQETAPVADGVGATETETRPAVEPEAVGNRESVATDVNESATTATA
ncbi:Sphingolipid long chain base-responsive protein LSP1 [Talaromyces pinophilus]|nr:Sphingolipid long chain base-responsive protein LSP1 [Talaromyces pinophilus]